MLIFAAFLGIIGWYFFAALMVFFYFKASLEKRSRALLWVPVTLLILAVFALSPLLIGLAGMAVNESITGITQNESNSVWGVLPWLTIATGAIAIGAVPFVLLGGAIHAFILTRKKKTEWTPKIP